MLISRIDRSLVCMQVEQILFEMTIELPKLCIIVISGQIPTCPIVVSLITKFFISTMTTKSSDMIVQLRIAREDNLLPVCFRSKEGSSLGNGPVQCFINPISCHAHSQQSEVGF